MQGVYEKIHADIGLAISTQEKIFESLVIVAVLLVLRFVLVRAVNQWISDVTQKYFWRRVVGYSLGAFALILVGRVWFQGIQALATAIGIAGAGLFIALQDSLLNIAGWAFIVLRHPFRVGDRVESGGIQGDVIDIRLFQFSILEIGNWVDADQSTGRIIHIPNGKVFKDPLVNYSQGFEFIWNELPVLVTFESNWEEAKKILQQIADDKAEKFSKEAEKEIVKAAEKYMILFNKLTPIVYTAVKNSGVMLTIRYLTRPRTRRGTEEAIWEEILRAFARREDIDFAYPTTRFYNNYSEGKSGTRPDGGNAPPG